MNCLETTNLIAELQIDDSILNKEMKTFNLSNAFKKQQQISQKIKETFGENKAEFIMGTDYFGPKQVETALGIKIDPADIPPLPNIAEIIAAKKNNFFLILRVDHDQDGQPINNYLPLPPTNPNNMNSDKDEIKERLESIFKHNKVRPGWAMVRKSMSCPSGRTFAEKLDNFLQNLTSDIPAISTALDDYNHYREFLLKKDEEISDTGDTAMRRGKVNGIMESIGGLPICKLIFQTPAEALYDATINPNFLGKNFYGSMVIPYFFQTDYRSIYCCYYGNHFLEFRQGPVAEAYNYWQNASGFTIAYQPQTK
ncbi:MAG: hypothetical protein NTW50_00810 [Candidatus Berkelbacteria bacterium]|nr:hypothetical protein [Candidatus Berkelbacteria bacterium]